jgi:hypothetical protein
MCSNVPACCRQVEKINNMNVRLLTIMFICTTHFLAAQYERSWLELDFDAAGGGDIFVMQKGYDEYHDGKLIMRHGRKIKFLFFLPPKYKLVKDTFHLKMIDYPDEIYGNDSIVYFEHNYPYIEGYIERYIDNPVSDCYPKSTIFFYSKRIKSYYKSIQKKFERENFDSIKNEILDFPIEYYIIDVPFRVLWDTVFDNELLDGLTTVKMYHLEGLWNEVRAYMSCTGCSSWGVLEVQRALIKKGYQVPLNDMLDEVTKVALIRFQKNYNKRYPDTLKVGTICLNTSKALFRDTLYSGNIPQYQYQDSPWNKIKN